MTDNPASTPPNQPIHEYDFAPLQEYPGDPDDLDPGT